MKKSKIGGAALLVSASFIWGLAFVAQSAGMAYVGPFTFSAVRMLLGGLALLPVIPLFDKLGWSNREPSSRENWKAGLILGAIMFLAGNLQQVGLQYTTVAKGGFITSLYIVLVPIAGLLFLRRPVHKSIWLCVALACAGLYLLSMQPGSLKLNKGDLLILACAFAFTGQILTVDYFALRADVVRMSCIQFFTAALLSAAVIPLNRESPSLGGMCAAWLPIVYAGVLSGAVAYTMQMLGQKRIEPAAAALMLSPEAVYAALAGWILLGQGLTPRELLGCAMVFTAVILSQIPWKPRTAAPASGESS